MDRESVYLGGRKGLGDLELTASGKVRDIYAVDAELLLFVTSDRVSAFDVVMGRGVPHKGRVLTAIAAHWFERTGDVIANHLVSTDVDDVPGLGPGEREDLRGRIMLVHRCEPTPVEWVVRGYIAGSGWRQYQRTGGICGVALPAGLGFCQRLSEPIFTPTTKDEVHDQPLTAQEARARIGDDGVFQAALGASLALFRRGTEELERIDVLLADTKFEFGLRDGKLLLIDEALTPDSSRFWPAESYRVGQSPPSYDKQILRDWLETLDWGHAPPPPDVPDDVIRRLSQRYLEICERITGATPAGVPA